MRELIRSAGFLVLKAGQSGSLEVLDPVPSWFVDLRPDLAWGGARIDVGVCFEYLSVFLPKAEAFWDNGAAGACRSGWWCEQRTDGTTLPLVAEAYCIEGEQLVVIRDLGSEYTEREHLLQKAREVLLHQERMGRELDRKEVLMHCLIHDLAGPLSAMLGCWELLQREPLSERCRQILELGQAQGRRQANLIEDLLDIYRADNDQGNTNDWPGGPDSMPDLLETVEEVLRDLEPVLALKKVGAQLRVSNGSGSSGHCHWKVKGSKSKLERVLYNLLQNALRFTPVGGRLRVELRDEGQFCWTGIEDEGPGVDPSVAPHLFGRFVKGRDGGGKAGLGLFFCRIAVESFHGSIGYEPRSEGGALFWFRLPRPGAGDRAGSERA